MVTSRRKKTILVVAAILTPLLVLGGFFGGIAFERSRQDINLTTFWQVYELIKKNYVGEVNRQDLAEGAVRGLVGGLDDPYSIFLTDEERRSLEQDLAGEFEGIGAELIERDGLITVVAPIAGSPAEAAGVKAKDIILAVNDQSVEGKRIGEVVRLIRGPKGTDVRLTIGREGADQPLTLTIRRAKIETKSVTTKVLAENIGYLKISQFNDDTFELARSAVADFARQNVKALVIDVRDNPGGYLNAVPPVAGLFLPPSVIVKERLQSGRTVELRSTADPIMPTTPIYVLVNGGSASASEILAGALEDHNRATIIGEKTFGKGSVQDLIDLANGAAVKITVAEWLTPKGREINKVGLEPMVVVEDKRTATDDPILNAALERIRT